MNRKSPKIIKEAREPRPIYQAFFPKLNVSSPPFLIPYGIVVYDKAPLSVNAPSLPKRALGVNHVCQF